jgi:hypothetical protein
VARLYSQALGSLFASSYDSQGYGGGVPTRLRRNLQLNGSPQGSIDSVINSKGSSHPDKEEKPLGSVYIPNVKGVSEKFRRTGNPYNIGTIFKTKDTLRSSLMKSRPERDPQQMAQCIYNIPRECGRIYTDETG